MKNASKIKKSKSEKEISEVQGIVIAAASAALCTVLMCCIVQDCEKYKKDDSVSAALTYTPPKKREAEGFWDIFTDAVSGLFGIGS